LNLPNESKPVFTLSDYKETGDTANDVYPRSFSVSYSFILNGYSRSGILKGVIQPRKTIDVATGKERNMVICFSFQFSSVQG